MIQNGVQEAEAILVGQIQNGVDHRKVHSALERAVIGDLLLEDAQNGHHQRDGIEGENSFIDAMKSQLEDMAMEAMMDLSCLGYCLGL